MTKAPARRRLVAACCWMSAIGWGVALGAKSFDLLVLASAWGRSPPSSLALLPYGKSYPVDPGDFFQPLSVWLLVASVGALVGGWRVPGMLRRWLVLPVVVLLVVWVLTPTIFWPMINDLWAVARGRLAMSDAATAALASLVRLGRSANGTHRGRLRRQPSGDAGVAAPARAELLTIGPARPIDRTGARRPMHEPRARHRPATVAPAVASPTTFVRSCVLAVAVVACAQAVAASGAPAVSSPCLSLDAGVVHLAGRLERQTHFGRPGYGEDPRHDERETGFYLRLERPTCAAGPDDPVMPDVRWVQLVLDRAGYARLRPRLGRSIALSGTLFGMRTAHHHAAVLMVVTTPVVVERGH